MVIRKNLRVGIYSILEMHILNCLALSSFPYIYCFPYIYISYVTTERWASFYIDILPIATFVIFLPP